MHGEALSMALEGGCHSNMRFAKFQWLAVASNIAHKREAAVEHVPRLMCPDISDLSIHLVP
jgi:hypothetical protein